MKRLIYGAEQLSPEDRLKDTIDKVSDTCSYILDGLDYLSQSGAEGIQQAQIVADRLNEVLNEYVSLVADNLTE